MRPTVVRLLGGVVAIHQNQPHCATVPPWWNFLDVEAVLASAALDVFQTTI